jgi:CRISPR/Cas system-associated exonuclease Cas4 (RecB family)
VQGLSMALPRDFQFSQNSLQDYVDCPRRFQLRYLLRQPWPAVPSEPVAEYERILELAQRFHKLAQRHNSGAGLSEAQLSQSVDDDDLRRWWRNYLSSPPPRLPTGARHPEIVLTAPVGGYRMVARYDLLALDPGRRAVIVDWKTNRRRPSSAALTARMQTRVYRSVLVEAGTALNGGAELAPEQVTMIYWFAEHPADPEILPYDSAQYEADAAYLADLVSRIAARAAAEEEEWPLTPDESQCRFCTYRSLCDRGVLPGPLAELDTDQALELSLEFEFEELDEIEY